MIPSPTQELPLTSTDPSQTGPFLTFDEHQALHHARPALPAAQSRASAHALNVWANDTLPELSRARRAVVRLMWAARRAGDHATRAECRVSYLRLLQREAPERERQAKLAKSRRTLVLRMWKARKKGNATAYPEAQRSYQRVCRRQRQSGRLPLAEDIARRPLASTPPAQQLRFAQQRVLADVGRIPADVLAEERRDRTLTAANALAHALWGIHQGHRSWTLLGVKPSIAQASAPQEQRTNGTFPSPKRLELRVPGSGMELHLYRAEYEALLESWGWARLVKAEGLAARLEDKADQNTRRDVDTLYDLALSAVFVQHSSGSMQLSPHRNGDLREAVLAIYALCNAALA